MEFSEIGCRFCGGDLAKAMTSMGDGVLLQDYGESPEVQASRSIGEEEEEWDLRYSPSPGSGEGRR